MSPDSVRWPKLFSPCRFLGLALANRLAVGPMTRISATPEGCATQEMAEYLAEFVRGGFSLVIAEATYVDEAYSQGWWNQPGIADAAQAQAWRAAVEAVHAAGGAIVLQLYHAGSVNQGNRFRADTVGPSAVRPPGEQAVHHGGSGIFPVPREITRAEMAEVVEAFAQAARRAIEAGFDGVEVHGANGYLLDQFLTTTTNLRRDEYGGTVENRVRFPAEVLAAVRRAVPQGRIVGIRLSPTKSTDLSYDWPGGVEEARIIFSTLGGIGELYIHTSANLGIANPVFGTPESLPSMARRFCGRPVIACGQLDDPDLAERLLAAEALDIVALSRAALADPQWPAKIRRGETPIAFAPEALVPNSRISSARAWRERLKSPL